MVGKRFGKRKGRIMFPTTHDITEENFGLCRDTIVAMLEKRNELLIVSKPDPLVIRRLCRTAIIDASKSWITFRFTIGSMDPRALAFWEPGAPAFAQRLYALMWCYDNGWRTSVSMEPMLDERLGSVVKLYRTLEPFVTDTIWLGRMNHALLRIKVNGHENYETRCAVERLASVFDDNGIRTLAAMLDHPRPKLRWKESCKKALGIALETEAGTDR
jgi:hypothetical protein